jgi:hypothetical protein
LFLIASFLKKIVSSKTAASYQVSVHLAKRFQRRRFLKISRSETRIAYGPSIDASYQVSLALAEGFQRKRLKCEKLTDDRRWTPSDGKSSCCLWQGELTKVTAKNRFNAWYPPSIKLTATI